MRSLKERFDKLMEELGSTKVEELPPPQGVCDECAKRTPQRLQQYPSIYCNHNAAGAIYDEALRRWITISPVDLADFGTAIGILSAILIHVALNSAPPSGDRH